MFARGRTKEEGSTNSRGKFRLKSKGRKGKCRYCKKEGHWKAECPKLKDKLNKVDNTSYDGDTANIATDNSDGAGYVLTISSSLFADAWVLDFRCFYHMCHDKDWFVNY